ncbi:NAD(P)-dependent oxidoreductase [Enterobacter sp. Cy-643]|uniref:NAD(P)-dependent oxidoreductase n=1 Tax=Enterobacter sp. Cy-643 TaxID=2608346 RepID=UPI0014247EA8|nr:NAD(P)-dependent oxidoreductase [Enterobacter sp. Cy-643]NIF31752.1 NAD(P)-dependent oxidoreductase [Enterobacter sp. Cy-643]
MSNITVLGLGAMGSRMATRLLTAGHSVTVWNRTGQATEALASQGATVAPTPKSAVADAEFVIAMVRDDAASRRIWLDEEQGALSGMAAAAVAIESSTLTPGWVKTLGSQMQRHDIAFLEAPVSGSRVQVDSGQLAYLLGGDPFVVERCLPVLKAMGSAFHHVGELGEGTLAKLATNALMAVQVTGLAEIIGFLKRSGADANRVLSAMAGTSVWPAVAGYLSGSMLSENFAPQFPVELIEKDLGYTLQEMGSSQLAPMIDAARGVFLHAIDEGLAESNMTSVIRLYDKL